MVSKVLNKVPGVEQMPNYHLLFDEFGVVTGQGSLKNDQCGVACV